VTPEPLPEPNLVIIGAQKSGTTSLYHYLNAHPDIFMCSPVKEPGYFMKTEFVRSIFQRMKRPVASRREALERFMLKGYRPTRYFGDASTFYTLGRLSIDHEVPARMRQVNPDMKLIYIVRDPFARIASSYLHALRAGYVSGSFADYFGTKQYEQALLTSRYWSQLEVYLTHFPREQIKVITFEDLANQRDRVLADIFHFLELENSASPPPRVYNRSENRESLAEDALLFPPSAFRAAFSILDPEIRALQEFLGHPFEEWTPNAWCRAA
jgi:hypothetical protein